MVLCNYILSKLVSEQAQLDLPFASFFKLGTTITAMSTILKFSDLLSYLGSVVGVLIKATDSTDVTPTSLRSEVPPDFLC